MKRSAVESGGTSCRPHRAISAFSSFPEAPAASANVRDDSPPTRLRPPHQRQRQLQPRGQSPTAGARCCRAFGDTKAAVVMEAEHASARVRGKTAEWQTLNGVGYNGAWFCFHHHAQPAEAPRKSKASAPRLDLSPALAPANGRRPYAPADLGNRRGPAPALCGRAR